jgi:hypothetical protein
MNGCPVCSIGRIDKRDLACARPSGASSSGLSLGRLLRRQHILDEYPVLNPRKKRHRERGLDAVPWATRRLQPGGAGHWLGCGGLRIARCAACFPPPRWGQGKVSWRKRRSTFSATFERRRRHHLASQRRAVGDALDRPVV